MAYVPQQIPDEEQNKFANPNQTTPNPIPPQGGSSGAAPAGGRAAPGMGTSTQFGSNAAKLSDYLTANKDQVGQFGQQVAGQLSQNYGDTMNAIDQGYGQFGQQIGQGYTPQDSTLVSQAANNPTDFAKDPNNVSSFQKQFNDQYTGPSNFESSSGYQNLNDQVNKAVENAGLTNSFSGLQTYLTNNMNTGHNTQGMQTLDAALLQRSPEASQAISQAASPYKNLAGYLGDKTAGLNSQIQTAQSAADTARTAAQNKFTGQGGLVPTLQNTLTQQQQNAQSQASNSVQQAIQDWQAGSMTPADMATLGFNSKDLSDQAYSRFGTVASALGKDYNAAPNVNSLFTQTPSNVYYATPGSTATPDQIAQAQALQSLTGQDLTGFMGATSPNGQLVQTNRQALDDMSQNLGARDTTNVANWVRQVNQPGMNQPVLGPQTSESDVMKYLANTFNDPNQQRQVDYILSQLFNPAQPSLVDALGRLGFKQPGAPLPTPGDGTGYVHASSTPGVF